MTQCVEFGSKFSPICGICRVCGNGPVFIGLVKSVSPKCIIITGRPDNSGIVFYIPVTTTDGSFTLYVTPAEAETSVMIKILEMDGIKLLANHSVISQTLDIEKSMLNLTGVGVCICAIFTIFVFSKLTFDSCNIIV